MNKSDTLNIRLGKKYADFLAKSENKTRTIENALDLLITEDKPDIEQFKEGYKLLKKGRLCYIWELRKYLNWSRDRFDSIVKSLVKDCTIQLHGGDPSILTRTQVENSFKQKDIYYLSFHFIRGE